VDYDRLAQRLRAWKKVARVTQYGAVKENGRSYPLLRLDVPGENRVLITAGFHGEEPAGPLTLARHFGSIAARAKRKGVGLTVFPCINPSGFESGFRYNASGEKPNNDFLRYEVRKGRWKGELLPGERFRRWKRFTQPPQETRALRLQLDKLAPPIAALDLHQDNYSRLQATYAYVFGDRRLYLPMTRAAAKHLKLGKRMVIDPSYHTDSAGLVWFHDGSVTDYCFRRGVPYCATLETTTCSPMQACHAVNLVWIRGFIDLAAAHR
jgi:predicted deacylase